MMMEVSSPPEYARTTFLGLFACLFTNPLSSLAGQEIVSISVAFPTHFSTLGCVRRGAVVRKPGPAPARVVHRHSTPRGIASGTALARSLSARTCDFRIDRGPRIAGRRGLRR